MWVATLEDADGMWIDDPIGDDTQDRVTALARERWGVLVHGVRVIEPGRRIVVWRCQEVATVE
jgi:hypothetical protein